MIRTVFETPSPSFKWIDVSDPTHEELHGLEGYPGLEPGLIRQCLDPLHLPKHERTAEASFMILRVYDESERKGRRTLRGLTRKLAVFQRDGLLITIHRKDMGLILEVAEKARSGLAPQSIVHELAERVIASYRAPLEEVENALDRAEGTLFSRSVDTTHALKRVHSLKRTATVVKRMMLHTTDTLRQMEPQNGGPSHSCRFLMESAQALYLVADELLDDLNSLISTQLALGAQHTNEVVRILTLFSAVFMPLTFIVGVYGMNFRYMPEIAWQYGYGAAWLLMISVTAIIWGWFKRRGWLG